MSPLKIKELRTKYQHRKDILELIRELQVYDQTVGLLQRKIDRLEGRGVEKEDSLIEARNVPEKETRSPGGHPTAALSKLTNHLPRPGNIPVT